MKSLAEAIKNTKGIPVRIDKIISKMKSGSKTTVSGNNRQMKKSVYSYKKSIRFYALILLGAVFLAGIGGIVYDRGLLSFSGTSSARASLAPRPHGASFSGLPVPRFVSLKKNRINIRRGPGTNHAVQWVFNRKGLPVEVIAEFENWRRIRDADGEEGWVFHSLLSGVRMVTVAPWDKNGRIELSEKPSRLSKIIAFMEPGVMAKVRQCSGSWCAVRVGDYEGWVAQNSLWGVYPGEVVN